MLCKVCKVDCTERWDQQHRMPACQVIVLSVLQKINVGEYLNIKLGKKVFELSI